MRESFLLGVAWALALHAAAAGGSWLDRGRQPHLKEVTTGRELQATSSVEAAEIRNKVYFRILKPQDPTLDWNADPTSLPAALYQFERRTGIATYANNEGLEPSSPNLFDTCLVYMTGHNAFSFTEEEVANLREFIERGGTVILDDCLPGESAFGPCVEPEFRRVLPNSQFEIIEQEPPKDPRFVDLFKICYQFERTPMCTPGPHSACFDPMKAIWYKGRPVVTLSRGDWGCAWEIGSPPTPANLIGDDVGHGGGQIYRELVYRFTVNWTLYCLSH